MGEGKVEAESGTRKAQIESTSLVLTGFMGAGKTTIGRIIAERLGREFVDMDSMIERREGKPIREIFQTRGEEYFRACEAQLCVELASRKNLIIATGGGALIDPGNRERFREAFVVCLDASPDEIVMRLNGALDRPLLGDGDMTERVKQLLTARQAAYAQIKCHIDTNTSNPQEVADRILAAFREAIG